MNKEKFRKDLETIINQNSMENGSDTPDFILADYLYDCLENFNKTSNKRNNFYTKSFKVIFTVPMCNSKLFTSIVYADNFHLLESGTTIIFTNKNNKNVAVFHNVLRVIENLEK